MCRCEQVCSVQCAVCKAALCSVQVCSVQRTAVWDICKITDMCSTVKEVTSHSNKRTVKLLLGPSSGAECDEVKEVNLRNDESLT